MKPMRMDKALAAGLVFLFLLPAAATGGNDDGDTAPPGRAAPDHNGSLSISNFSACQLNNVALGPSGGAARLQRSEGCYAKVEFPVVSTLEDIYEPGLAVNSRGEFISVWR